MFTVLFWKDTAERVIVTFCQAVLALIIVAQATPLLNVDWGNALAVGATAAVIALLKAIIAGAAVKDSVSPASLVSDDRGVV